MATFYRILFGFTIHYHLYVYMTIHIICMSQQTMKNYITSYFVKNKVK